MSEIKRERARAIIIHEDKIISMYRERNGRVFYVFPGGGMENNETEEECVVREVIEEFGLTVKPIKKLYTYENDISIEHFYLCEWVAGEFGTGVGEEFEEDRNRGVYIPKMIEIKDIPQLPLMPPEVAKEFFNDYMQNGSEVRNSVKLLFGEIK